MSSTEVRKNSKAKANLVAFWEWFKSAAWLQVLLIVGVVVAVVVSIPYIIRAIPTESDSEFYETHRIDYTQLRQYERGEGNPQGTMGNDSGSFTNENNFEGFVVMFYEGNCGNCNDMEGYIQDWFDLANETIDGANLKFYTIDVSWVPDDPDKSESVMGTNGDISDYENEYITLDQQTTILREYAPVYIDEPSYYQNSSVDEADLQMDIASEKSTMPTPTIAVYTRTGTEGAFVVEKVCIGMMGSLSPSSSSDVKTMLNDLYHIRAYRG